MLLFKAIDDFADKIKIGDKIQLTDDVREDGNNYSMNKSTWVVKEKYKHHMIVEKYLPNAKEFTRRSIMYKMLMIYGENLRV